MQYLGEIISLGVALMWTVTALAAETGSKALGVRLMNVVRLGLASLFTSLLLLALDGRALPVDASAATWAWFALSGLVGFLVGDYCLFACYVRIGSCYGQLLMTLAPAAAAVSAWVAMGQRLSAVSLLAMAVTLSGIAMAILDRRDGSRLSFAGVMLGVGAGVCQGVGLVLSKLGLDSYALDLGGAVADGSQDVLMPVAGNLIRCITGFAGFALLLMWRGRESYSRIDRKGLTAAVVAVVFGPFLGVAGSLMAVQYTAAGIASTLMAITPVTILLPSHYLFGTPLTARTVAGAVVSCLGVALFFV